mmetsp:Transcript_50643/g.96706  ORF Transcript_50643/g.96706 Transcript_50643/m.96706 type:complete len:226 (-) Transcript_50643:148-825(-)
MYEVSHASAVARGVVRAVHGELLVLALGHSQQVGHEVVGDAVRVFADASRGVRAHGVEVAQRHHLPLGVLSQVLKHTLDDHLGVAVGVGGHGFGAGAMAGVPYGPARVLLLQRHLPRNAVHARRRRKHQPEALVGLHRAEDVHGGHQVVVVVPQWLLNTLAYCLECSKMDHRIKSVLFEHHFYVFVVEKVNIVPMQALACERFHSVPDLFLGVDEVVNNHHSVVC